MNQQHFPKLFKFQNSSTGSNDFPVYTINDGNIYRTIEHPHGWSKDPDYSLGDDGKLYRTDYHPKGLSLLPDYEFQGNGKLFRTQHHPDGKCDKPDYVIRD